ncbi:hypothetical protein [Muriventricola aceti]
MRADCLRHGGSITEGNRRYGTTRDSAGRIAAELALSVHGQAGEWELQF